MKSIDNTTHDKKWTRECQYCIFWLSLDDIKHRGLCELNGKERLGTSFCGQFIRAPDSNPFK